MDKISKNNEEFEKMKQELIKNGFDWDNGWAFLPFVGAFFNMFQKPTDDIKESN